eukprot:NODE_14072_length_1130_cov_4.488534.p1 GENE.NODE_14072_length_1130_cov_4.488534~~NODE_14072_length_1130_cov_4.488534.p1  ORF type:complete len:264 (+),score=89.06 NODE_14072_length_1130_cov_4.488534:125-916(+)
MQDLCMRYLQGMNTRYCGKTMLTWRPSVYAMRRALGVTRMEEMRQLRIVKSRGRYAKRKNFLTQELIDQVAKEDAELTLENGKDPWGEAYVSLTGGIVRICTRHSARIGASGFTKHKVTPLAELPLGDIDHLSLDEVVRYEKKLCWTARRPLQERMERLMKEAVNNSLTKNMPTKQRRILDLTAEEREQLTEEELKQFEVMELIIGGEELSLPERRARLKEHVWRLADEAATRQPGKAQDFMKNWQENLPRGITDVIDSEEDD